MSHQPTRTELFEAHQARIVTLEHQGIDARTMARAYADLGDELERLPSKGDLWDFAQREMIEKARDRSLECRQLFAQRFNEAERLREEGIPL